MFQPEIEMACDDDWGAQQKLDEDFYKTNEKRAVTEAFRRWYLAINRLEILDNCSYTDLRADTRLVEMVMARLERKHECDC